MADRLDSLLAEIPDGALRDDIEKEVAFLRGRKEYGLVFNRRIPENIAVPGFPFVPGERVAEREGDFSQTWEIVEINGEDALCDDTKRRPLDDLVVVRRQDSPLFPFLEHRGSIGGGSGRRASPHALIEGENLQVLRLLAHTMPRSVDVIYIDPPYNTGARDWRYNNDYVDRHDPFRHSKWLAMMERRLRLARALLKPDGVIFVAIDENENAALTLLMRDVFTDLAIYNIALECYAGAFSGEQSSGFVTTHDSLVVAFPRQEDILSAPNKREGKEDIRNLYADGTSKWRRSSPLKF